MYYTEITSSNGFDKIVTGRIRENRFPMKVVTFKFMELDDTLVSYHFDSLGEYCGYAVWINDTTETTTTYLEDYEYEG